MDAKTTAGRTNRHPRDESRPDIRNNNRSPAREARTNPTNRIGGTAPVKIADEGFEATDKYLGRLCFFRKGRMIGGFSGLVQGADAVALTAKLAEGVK